ncbi:MAG: hypothetical protein ACRDJC_02460 [Thermomicrobiales bacterium]
MTRIDIAELDIIDRVRDKIWDHGIVSNQLYAVLDRFWTVIRNRKDRAAPYVLLGTDDQGRCLAIPIVPTDDPYVWRPVTAWYCKPGEAARLRQRRRIMEKGIRYESIQEPLDDEERELMDPDNWDWDNPIEGRTIGTPGAILRVRFSREEFLDLDRIAREAGVGPIELIRQTMLGKIAAETHIERPASA